MPKKGAQAGTGKANGSVKKLRKLMKDVGIAMLTSAGKDGTLRSRPMMTSQIAAEGDLWFIVKASSLLADEITDNQRVNVSYSNPKGDRYVSVSGTANLVRDPDKLRDLWSGKHKAWFPEGKRDPDLTLLKVTVDGADYWDARSSSMVHLAQFVKATPGASAPPQSDETTGAGAQG